MPKCPNCGQETMRTEDWACQWCGYPLLSPGYKKIDKTWKQIQEEKGEGKFSASFESVEDTPPPAPELKFRPKMKPTPPPIPAGEPELEYDNEEEPPPPVVRPQFKPRPAPVPQPEPEVEYELPPAVIKPQINPQPLPAPQPAARVEPPVIRREPEPVIEPEPVPPPSIPVARSAPAPAPAPVPKTEPTPVNGPMVETALAISADDLLSAYMLNDTAAHEKFTNKILRVTGVVGKVTVNDMRAVYSVFLTSPQMSGFRDVECRFTRQYATMISQFKPGQSITVQGRYFGYVINVILRACTLVN